MPEKAFKNIGGCRAFQKYGLMLTFLGTNLSQRFGEEQPGLCQLS
jgi:hypothetical protein